VSAQLEFNVSLTAATGFDSKLGLPPYIVAIGTACKRLTASTLKLTTTRRLYERSPMEFKSMTPEPVDDTKLAAASWPGQTKACTAFTTPASAKFKTATSTKLISKSSSKLISSIKIYPLRII
jgi:hypothetical protein